MNGILILEELMTHYQIKLYISNIQNTSPESNQAKTHKVNENFLEQDYLYTISMFVYFTNVYETYSKSFKNIDVYTNFNPEIWLLGCTILSDSSEF